MNVKEKPNPNQVPSVPMQKRLFSIEEAVTYLGIGKSSARKFLESIGAKHQIGRRVLYDKETIDNYLSNKKEDNKNEQY